MVIVGKRLDPPYLLVGELALVLLRRLDAVGALVRGVGDLVVHHGRVGSIADYVGTGGERCWCWSGHVWGGDGWLRGWCRVVCGVGDVGDGEGRVTLGTWHLVILIAGLANQQPSENNS